MSLLKELALIHTFYSLLYIIVARMGGRDMEVTREFDDDGCCVYALKACVACINVSPVSILHSVCELKGV